MALVRITNIKGDKLTVPAGAYKEIYKPQGWTLCGKDENTQKQDLGEGVDETSFGSENSENDHADAGKTTQNDETKILDEDFKALKVKAEQLDIEGFESMTKEELESAIEEFERDEEDDEDLSEIPLSEMSVPQLHKYASQLGIDVSKLNGAKALREAIKKSQKK